MNFDGIIKNLLVKTLTDLEKKFEADIVFYLGEIDDETFRLFRDLIGELRRDDESKNRLAIFLNTDGGSAEIVERVVDIIRRFYDEVYFVIPDFAMSAGTIFCTSGDKIYMDYSSSLGPIDPQVWNGKQWVPALAYLDKVDELMGKAQAGTITQAELLILRSQDLAELGRCRQAKELTITLLKKWLVEYMLRGTPETVEQKENRAREIADELGKNQRWHSHARRLSLDTLRSIGLKIEDFSDDEDLRRLIHYYHDLITEFVRRNHCERFLHSRRYV
jgi:membrane-bound ClpP family serine protease